MPKQTSSSAVVEDGGGEQTNVGAIEITLGDGTRKQFANLDELREDYTELFKSNGSVKTLQDENVRLARLEKLAKAAVLVGTADSERQLYEELGVDQREIARIMRNRDSNENTDDEEEEEERPTRRSSSRGGDNGVDLDALAERVLAKMGNRKVSFRDWDEESYKYLEELVRRLDSATTVVKESSQRDVESMLSTDKVVRDYWGVMSDRQKSTAVKHVLSAAGQNVLSGKRPTTKELEGMRGEMRNYLTDVYGSAKELRSARNVPTLLNLGEDTTGFEDLSDEELSERIEDINTKPVPAHKGAEGLGARLRAAAELDRRVAKR